MDSATPTLLGKHGLPGGLSEPSRLHATADITLFALLGGYACNTATAYLCLAFELQFSLFAYITLGLTLLSFCYILFKGLNRPQSPPSTGEESGFYLLFGFCLATASLALLLHRPDADDYYYLANARFYIENPSTPLSLEIHFLHSDAGAFQSLSWATSTPYELFAATLSLALDIDLLHIYYYLFPFITGFLIPLALFHLTRLFTPSDLAAFVGVLAALLVVTLLHDAHRTFGNFSLARAFQGKTLVLSVCIPALTAFTMRFLQTPDPSNWFKVLAVSTAALGSSASSIILLPPLGVIITISYWYATRESYRIYLPTLMLYFAAFTPAVVYALIYKLGFSSGLGTESPANAGWPTSFLGHLDFFRERDFPATITVVVAGILLALAVADRQHRKILSTWIGLAFLLLLNPLSANFLIEHITSPNIYWRLFYLLPFPLVIAIFFSTLFTRRELHSGIKPVTAISAGIITCLLLVSIFEHREIMRWSVHPKIPEKELQVAREINRLIEPGLMLAPQPISGILAILSSKYPQVAVREDAEITWHYMRNETDRGVKRVQAARFVNSGKTEDREAFKDVVRNYSIGAVILNEKAHPETGWTRQYLNTHGFCGTVAFQKYVVAIKGEDCAN